MLEINPWQKQIIPNIFKTRPILNSPEHIQRYTVGEQSPKFKEASQVVVRVILIVTRQREYVVVLMDAGRIGLIALSKGIVVPVSVLTVTFTQALEENHEGQRGDEKEVIEGPDVAGLQQQVVSLLQPVDR